MEPSQSLLSKLKFARKERQWFKPKALITNFAGVSALRLSDTNQLGKFLRVKPMDQISLLELSPPALNIRTIKTLADYVSGPRFLLIRS